MTLQAIPSGEAVFVDANVFIYSFTADPRYGQTCERLINRIETGDLEGYLSSHVLNEIAHRMMSIEAQSLFHWPIKGIAQRLRNHPAEVKKLTHYRRAIDEISLIGIRILPVLGKHVSLAVDVCSQFGLLSSDALIVTLMRDFTLTRIASRDTDFDVIPGIIRHEPA